MYSIIWFIDEYWLKLFWGIFVYYYQIPD